LPATKINSLAYLRGEERGTRYKYRHTPAGAERITKIPEPWIWLWIATGLLKSQNWQKKTWVRVEDVQALARSRRWLSRILPEIEEDVSTPKRKNPSRIVRLKASA